jgi:hypothetical protein
MENKDKINALEKLLSLKSQTLHTMMMAAMTWWVSSIVFCGSILAGTWIKRPELVQYSFTKWLFFGIGLIFFVLVLAFGFWLSHTFKHLCRDIKELRTQFALRADINIHNSQLRDSEYRIIRGGTAIGTCCFFLIIVAWLALWLSPQHSRPVEHYPQYRGIFQRWKVEL